MLHSAWLRNLIDHGQHLNAIVMYSHELDASNNAQAYLVMCLCFPIIGVVMGAIGRFNADCAAAPVAHRRWDSPVLVGSAWALGLAGSDRKLKPTYIDIYSLPM